MTELKKILSIYLDLYLHQIIIKRSENKGRGVQDTDSPRSYEGQTVFSVYKYCGYEGNS